jgi:hypothetical protein
MFIQGAATSSVHELQPHDNPAVDTEPSSLNSRRAARPEDRPSREHPAIAVASTPLEPVAVASACERSGSRRGSAASAGIALYLVSVGVVAALIISVFFGAGFLLLVSPAVGTIVASSARSEPEVRLPTAPLFFASDSDHQPPVAALPSSTTTSATTETPPVLPAVAKAPVSGSAIGSGEVRADVLPAITPPPSAVAAPPTPVPETVTVTVHPPTRFALSTSEAAELLEHGDALLRTGDIASARLFYERVASAGEGRAALRLGATYDPGFLNRAGLGNMQADPAQARLWYSRAADLGEAEAKKLLDGVGTRHGD